jgi:serine/threonine protein phosphatase PrpC
MLILATDGLWDVMKPADAVAVVKRVLQHGGSVQLKAEALGDAATSLARTAAQVNLAPACHATAANNP